MGKNVFICKWKKIDDQWHVWIKGMPALFGRGETIEIAQAELQDQIWNNAKDLDAVIPTVMEFDPPLPLSETTKTFFTPEIYAIYGDGRFDLINQADKFGTTDYIKSLYERGTCEICKHGLGKRTNTSFIADALDGNYDGLWLFHTHIQINAYLFSSQFISLLTEEERSRLTFAPAKRKRKGKRTYYELTGNTIASNVGVKGLDAEGTECTKCGSRRFFINEPNLDFMLQNFLCIKDLPNPLPSCFAANINNVPTLCMTRQRWDQIRGHANAKGIVSERVGIVDSALCERTPRLQTSYRQCENCAKWQNPGFQRFWELPVVDTDLKSHLAVLWLKNEIRKPKSITIMRQDDTVDRIIELAQNGKKIVQGRTISFHCPQCWRLGQFSVSTRAFGLSW